MSEAAIEVAIESLAAGGEGVARDAGGRVVFVPLAAPGDRVRVRIVETHARFARGEIEAVLEPGASRVAPACPVFGVCGGCAWQHVGYAAQLGAKRAILRDALERIGGIAVPEIELVASPEPYGYRSRARVLASGGRVGFRKRRSHEVCAIAHCPLLAAPLDAALAQLAASAPAADGEWELALGSDGAVRVAPLGVRAAPGDRVVLRAAGESIAVSSGVFAQANALLQDALAQTVLDAAGQGGEVLELFAGAGFFTLGLARRFARVVAIESDAAAAADLAHNCAAFGNVRAIESRVETALADPRALRLAPGVVVLDPPRGGIGTRASEQLARLGAERIVHVSCDPATLARDLGVLAAQALVAAARRRLRSVPADAARGSGCSARAGELSLRRRAGALPSRALPVYASRSADTRPYRRRHRVMPRLPRPANSNALCEGSGTVAKTPEADV